ncbi:MAG: hypothetical protein M0Z28_09610 [Rhodospirillales bacterium]|nr:hypothetical protein [Rhodospirillales bacterium]
MRVLVIDTETLFLDFVLRAAAAGHDVRWYRHSPRKPIHDGDGFAGFQRVADWRQHMAWAREGLIVNTGNAALLHELDRYRELPGYDRAIFGPSVASARLEIDRGAGMEAFKAVGIELVPYQTVASLDEAEAVARRTDRALVFKPAGSTEDKSATYVAKDPADLVGWLRRKKARGGLGKGPFMLQDKLDMVGELSVAGWFGPEGFLPDKWNVCAEFKKFMAGDIGMATGEMGSVTQYVRSDKLAAEALEPLAPILRTLGHRGDICVSGGMDARGRFSPFEFTCRFGYPAWFNQSACHRGDPVEWMRDLLAGRDTLRVSHDVCVSVVLGAGRFPHNATPPDQIEGLPIAGVEDVIDDLHLCQVMRGMAPVMQGGEVVDVPTCQVAGEYVAVATGTAPTVEAARKSVYATVDAVAFPDKMYRNDIGCSLRESLPKFHAHGYYADMRYD